MPKGHVLSIVFSSEEIMLHQSAVLIHAAICQWPYELFITSIRCGILHITNDDVST
jgi:hypothetical protein